MFLTTLLDAAMVEPFGGAPAARPSAATLASARQRSIIEQTTDVEQRLGARVASDEDGRKTRTAAHPPAPRASAPLHPAALVL